MTIDELSVILKWMANDIREECNLASTNADSKADRKSLTILGGVYSLKCKELANQLRDYKQAFEDLTK